MAKITKAAFKSRLLDVKKLLLEGQTRAEIVRIGEGKWKIGARQVDKYIHEATKEIEEITQATAERTLSLLTSNLWALYRKNSTKKPAIARQTLMDIAKLNGLDKIILNLKVDRPLKDVSDDELNNALAGGT